MSQIKEMTVIEYDLEFSTQELKRVAGGNFNACESINNQFYNSNTTLASKRFASPKNDNGLLQQDQENFEPSKPQTLPIFRPRKQRGSNVGLLRRFRASSTTLRLHIHIGTSPQAHIEHVRFQGGYTVIFSRI